MISRTLTSIENIPENINVWCFKEFFKLKDNNKKNKKNMKNFKYTNIIYVLIVSSLAVLIAFYVKDRVNSQERAIITNVNLIETEIKRIGKVPDSINNQQIEENRAILEKHLSGYTGWLTPNENLVNKLHYTCGTQYSVSNAEPNFHYRLFFSDTSSVLREFSDGEAIYTGTGVLVYGMSTKDIIANTADAVREAQDSFIKKLRRIPN